MHTIEVDFDVFKQLTVRRATEDVSYNDVIRELLGLGESKEKASKEITSNSSTDWVAKGVRFAAGTEFRATYKGQIRVGVVERGALVVDGKQYDSPSAAAVAITGSPVNGWRFWDCRFPGKSSWQPIETLRRLQ
jgi:predicted CopG family antitoxin